ncbi:hypothetical protein AM493_16355 [Flavobacterium akiainvivens]|uniref:Secretion system C-terminal sorting domain-containing protein n=1 Tax=Flavobacterium akiainvivens TaxID=1202724 RepID=A0A0M9VJ62_9FLAO|nr:T9SS type A sorting domain-containing protein [Flavobacterium akiainvivens]KOS07440.1 hypothetical protein AM493_16355 [Flavobacterium akiainvivens]SFQ48178.1 Por secretion system C-terminal sorting domain-containing protein [Flavobacterium akiainvivens]
MKKTTLLFAGLLFSGGLFAQATPYTTLAEFESAYTGTLITEDFTAGPNDPAICGEVVTNAGDDCFTSGQVVAGFELSASNNSVVVYLPPGFLPGDNATPRLGANTGIENTILTFTEDNIVAVGHALHVDNGGNFNYKVYGTDDTVLYDQDVAYTPFYGIITTQPIGRIEITSVAGAGELIGDLKFGADVMALNDVALNTFSCFPNPSAGVLNVQSAGVIASVSVVNVLGQEVLAQNVNAATATLNISELKTGSYFVKAVFENGATHTSTVIKQ